jgi:laminin alpha 1/2
LLQVCDDKDPEHRHPISNAIDGTNSWWQSPTLQNGRRYEFVTITLDLKQVCANISPQVHFWSLKYII